MTARTIEILKSKIEQLKSALEKADSQLRLAQQVASEYRKHIDDLNNANDDLTSALAQAHLDNEALGRRVRNADD